MAFSSQKLPLTSSVHLDFSSVFTYTTYLPAALSCDVLLVFMLVDSAECLLSPYCVPLIGGRDLGPDWSLNTR